MVGGTLGQPDREEYPYFLQEGFRYAFQVFAEVIVAQGMKCAGAAVFSHADADHFQETRFMGRFEMGVRFDFVEQNDPVGFVGGFVAIDRHAIGKLIYLYCFHGGDDRYAQVLFADAELGQMLFLSFCCRTGMTAHGRENKGAGSPFLQLAAQKAEQFFVIRYATAAGRNADTLAFYSRSQFAFMGGELLL